MTGHHIVVQFCQMIGNDRTKNWRLQDSISPYQQGQISLERAAVDAGLSLSEMMDELYRRGISLDQTTPDEAREQV